MHWDFDSSLHWTGFVVSYSIDSEIEKMLIFRSLYEPIQFIWDFSFYGFGWVFIQVAILGVGITPLLSFKLGTVYLTRKLRKISSWNHPISRDSSILGSVLRNLVEIRIAGRLTLPGYPRLRG